MRHSIEQIASWYRYRQNVSEANSERSTDGRSFNKFALAIIEGESPVLAAIGSQHNFLSTRRGASL